MPDPTPPPSEDPFADLYGRLPDARSRADADGDTVPKSRREAREAAARASHEPPAQPPTVAIPVPEPAPEPAPALDDLFATAGRIPPTTKKKAMKTKKRRRRGLWIALVIVVVLVGGAAGGGLWAWNAYGGQIRSALGWGESKDYAEGMAQGQATVTIRTGDGGQQISQSLYNAGVTKTADAFYDMLVKLPSSPTFYPGVYKLQQQMSATAALQALQDPANKMDYTAQIPEGLTVSDTISRLSDSLGIPLSDFQAAVANPATYQVSAGSLEGWLFPATYTFDPGVTAQEVIQTMVNRAVQSLDAAGVTPDQRQRILTIASIIQREARQRDDFYKVSRVIQNRLAADMLLQMDSTAQYGYNELHNGTVSSSEAALTDDNPWNTYVNKGLPKGPISNPGDVAIDAAMHPVDGPWLYFVTVNLDTGETVFSVTVQDHDAAVAQWRQWCVQNPNSGC
ncbi:endolytic transglycosylase MltG [Microbacterium sp. X-17]|uniref:endolytic transglycosylase MltG n=1 Tax=Microbacterium sp. X-17 TaxID=3144404 RepID=UPI0031F5034B